ncbi:MAG: hypothetical protein PHW21_02825 [Candidatus Izemoplasmatales bacterium]|nr:hypothetical protein [Candidatus Izemoplasmatales bacterium]
MRIFVRVLYSMLAVGIFLWIWVTAQDVMEKKFWQPFSDSLTDESSDLPDFYYFYTSIPNYHKSEPIISIEIDGYEIKGYEVAVTAKDEDDNLVIEESIYIIVYSDNQDLSQVKELTLFETTGEKSEVIWLTRFKHLNLINAINELGEVYIPKDLFLSGEFDRIKLTNHDDEVLIESALNIDESSFTIKSSLEQFYQEHDKLPDAEDIDDLSSQSIGMQIIHEGEEFKVDGDIFFYSIGGYLIVLLITTYLLFFRKARYE